jgi:beta-glucosidase-like glycosyl hydrolase
MHRQLALEAAEQAITLLRNQDGLLPVEDKRQRLAFLGWHANSTQALLSTYQGANILVNSHSALQAATRMGLDVTYARGVSEQVRKTPSWSRSWTNFSLSYSCIPT